MKIAFVLELREDAANIFLGWKDGEVLDGHGTARALQGVLGEPETDVALEVVANLLWEQARKDGKATSDTACFIQAKMGSPSGVVEIMAVGMFPDTGTDVDVSVAARALAYALTRAGQELSGQKVARGVDGEVAQA